MPKVELDAIEQTNRTGYPPPYDAPMSKRHYRRLGEAAGLTDFGVSHVVLEPGGISSQRHWHEGEDEFVVLLEGEAVLIEDEGETEPRRLLRLAQGGGERASSGEPVRPALYLRSGGPGGADGLPLSRHRHASGWCDAAVRAEGRERVLERSPHERIYLTAHPELVEGVSCLGRGRREEGQAFDKLRLGGVFSSRGREVFEPRPTGSVVARSPSTPPVGVAQDKLWLRHSDEAIHRPGRSREMDCFPRHPPGSQ
jgi:hypothetical protein